MNDSKRYEISQALLNGSLFQAIDAAAERLRMTSFGNYDALDREGRRFALLCWALEQSAARPEGVNASWSTSINLHGALRALNDITKG